MITQLVFGENGWHLTSMIGTPVSFDNDLILHSDGQTRVYQAKYEAKPFSDFPYWSLRSDYWLGENAFGLELVHHKVYLKNTNDYLNSFSVSDGYNLIYLNYGRRLKKSIIVRAGFGVIFGNPDVRIKGRERYLHRHLKGMHFGGYTTQISVERWVYENQNMFVNVETKLTHSTAKLPVSTDRSEYAIVPDTAIHFNVGFGTKPKLLTGNLKQKLGFFAPLIVPNVLYALRSNTVE
jgi:hypothetical protein